MKLHWILYSTVMIFFLITSQVGAQDSEKWTTHIHAHRSQLAPDFIQKINSRQEQDMDFIVSVNKYEPFLKKLDARGLTKKITHQYPSINTLTIRLNPDQLFSQILSMEEVRMVDVQNRVPREERAVDNFDLGVNQVNYLHHYFPEWNGQGINISVKEQSMDSLDIDFAGRFISSNNPIPGLSSHATIMASMLGGAGNSSPSGKGVAWKAGITSTSFFNLFPESDAYYQTYNLSIQNHSYGLGIENFYGAEAAAYDDHIYSNKNIVHVFSAGNIGDSTSTEGPYAGIPGFANLTGTFKMGKNVLTVGSVDGNMDIQSRSSRGPAYDGRVKPELMALGQDGSSGAAAITSGVTALLQQAYFEQTGSLPPNGLVRALLLNAADDLHTPGPDFLSGYGNVNARKAVETLENQQFFRGTISQGESASFTIEVPDNARNLKITLAWIDPVAPVNAASALVNDLDMTISHTETAATFLPWVLDPQPSIQSLGKAANRGADHLNNQEQISIAEPLAGEYLIEVSGFAVSQGPQDYFIAYEWEKAEEVVLTYPTRSDVLLAGEEQFIRWAGQTSFSGTAAYQIIGTEQWVIMEENIDLGEKKWSWTTPDTTVLAQVRLEYGDQILFSDTFAISREPEVDISLDCEDFIQLDWEAIPGVDRYQVYAFDGDQLRPIEKVDQPFISIQKSSGYADYFAIAPIIGIDRLGQRSNTLFIAFKNAGCYIKSFFASQVGERAQLKLELETTNGISTIDFQKRINGVFQTIATVANNTALEVIEFDNSLEIGRNIYRAVVRLSTGEELISPEGGVFYILPNQFLLYPNPLSQDENIIIATESPKGEIIELYDALGRLVIRYDLLAPFETLETINLPAGIYFYQILSEGERLQEGKIVIK